MRAGQESWEFRGSLGFPTHAALYVRDALGLDTSADDVAPPALAADVPDRSDRLAPVDRSGAAAAWLGVWHALVDRPDSPFVALESLRRAPFVAAVWDEAVLWSNAARRGAASADPTGPIRWDIVQAVAAGVARDLGVGLERMRGGAEFVLVCGDWWRVARPGLVVASVQAASDPASATALLRAAFVSALEG
ncbi:hypothetical protein [Sinomonas sp. R1AF57]|uniref:hypothetical protein n=1 Tax=Sinomonas sp. R1AF57 TaxID=2020377 RepID=UPI000B60078D|nr:hypothetical protein [Sinomonas sp. R1AF57]ASN52002.1 hypothetical protein CGQ25_07870 [Sinomonas sp. R1AF57]